jgi:hypothetical protein
MISDAVTNKNSPRVEKIDRRRITSPEELITISLEKTNPFNIRLERYRTARAEILFRDRDHYFFDPEYEVYLTIMRGDPEELESDVKIYATLYDRILATVPTTLTMVAPLVADTTSGGTEPNHRATIEVSWLDTATNLEISVRCTFDSGTGSLLQYERDARGRTHAPRISCELRRYYEDIVYEEKFIFETETIGKVLKRIPYRCVYVAGEPYDGTTYDMKADRIEFATYVKGVQISREEIYLT